MDLVQVDMVDPQGAQTLLHAAPDPCRAGVADQCVAVHAQPALGGDHHLVHLTGQSSAEQAFRGPEPISLGRVEHVDAQLAGVTDALYRRPILDLTPFPRLAWGVAVARTMVGWDVFGCRWRVPPVWVRRSFVAQSFGSRHEIFDRERTTAYRFRT
ncbi:hypothetical protein LUX33_22555 [Actinomadura madurae]|nr:hypothetical protein [Actinomadura madurae]MCP9950923.1 hypothetical protein [Actinomadura madurae]MCP9980156.1 hypothetical protein [Actinomadura madurae]